MTETAKITGRISLVPKVGLSADLHSALTARVFAIEHEADTGPRSVWHHPGYQEKFYAILLEEPRIAIGTIYVAGTNEHTDVAWWIDSMFRRMGYGRKTIDVLAPMLIAKGVKRIGPLLVIGDYEASRRLAQQLRSHFE
jgi:hypothetical protein